MTHYFTEELYEELTPQQQDNISWVDQVLESLDDNWFD
jgi:hypothetical protein